MTDVIFIFSIWIHVLSAIAWFGSVLAMEFIIIPSFVNSNVTQNAILLPAASKRFARVAEISSGLILITGVYQTYVDGYLNTSLFTTTFGYLVLIKTVLFIVFAGLGVMAGIKITKIDQLIVKEKLDYELKQSQNLFYLDIVVGLVIIIIAVLLPVFKFFPSN